MKFITNTCKYFIKPNTNSSNLKGTNSSNLKGTNSSNLKGTNSSNLKGTNSSNLKGINYTNNKKRYDIPFDFNKPNCNNCRYSVIEDNQLLCKLFKYSFTKLKNTSSHEMIELPVYASTETCRLDDALCGTSGTYFKSK